MREEAKYPLPAELARHARRDSFSPDELRRGCREAGEGLGREDARKARFRAAAEMVEMWRGVGVPGRGGPLLLRGARLRYIKGHEVGREVWWERGEKSGGGGILKKKKTKRKLM